MIHEVPVRQPERAERAERKRADGNPFAELPHPRRQLYAATVNRASPGTPDASEIDNMLVLNTLNMKVVMANPASPSGPGSAIVTAEIGTVGIAVSGSGGATGCCDCEA